MAEATAEGLYIPTEPEFETMNVENPAWEKFLNDMATASEVGAQATTETKEGIEDIAKQTKVIAAATVADIDPNSEKFDKIAEYLNGMHDIEKQEQNKSKREESKEKERKGYWDKFVIKGKWFQNVKKTLGGILEKSGSWLWTLLKGLFLLTLFDPSGKLATSIMMFVMNIGVMIFKMVAKTIPRFIKVLFNVIIPTLAKAILDLAPVIWKAAVSAFNETVKALGNIPILKEAIKYITKFWEWFKELPIVKPIIEALGWAFKKLGSWLGPIIEKIKEFFGGVKKKDAEGLLTALLSIGAILLIGFKLGLHKLLGPALKVLKVLGKLGISLIKNIVWPIAKKVLGALMDFGKGLLNIGPATKAAEEAVTSMAFKAGQRAREWAMTAGSAVGDFAKNAGSKIMQFAKGGIKAVGSMAKSIIPLIISMGSAVWTAIPAMWAFIAPFLPLILVIAAVIAAIVLLIVYWDDVVAAIKTAWNWLASLPEKIWNWLKGIVQGIWDWFKSLSTTMKVVVGILAAILLAPLLPILALIAGIILLVKYWDEVVAAIDSAWQWVKDLSAKIWNWIVGVAKSIWKEVLYVGEILLLALAWIFALPVMLIYTFWDEIQAFAKGLFKGLKKLWSKISGMFGRIWDVLKEAFSWGNIKRVLEEVAKSIKDGLIKAFDTVKKKLASVLNGILSMARAVLKNITNIVTAAWHWVTRSGELSFKEIQKGVGLAKEIELKDTDILLDIAEGQAKLTDIEKSGEGAANQAFLEGLVKIRDQNKLDSAKMTSLMAKLNIAMQKGNQQAKEKEVREILKPYKGALRVPTVMNASNAPPSGQSGTNKSTGGAK